MNAHANTAADYATQLEGADFYAGDITAELLRQHTGEAIADECLVEEIRALMPELTPLDEALRVDLIDAAAELGHSTKYTGPEHCSVLHLLRVVAGYEDAVVAGWHDDTYTVSSGLFEGAYATPATIASRARHLAELTAADAS